MGIELAPIQTLKTILSPALLQSLQCLQFSSYELNEYAQEAALSNPLLDVEVSRPEPEPLHAAELEEPDAEWYSRAFRERRYSAGALPINESLLAAQEQSFTEYLSSQLRQMPLLRAEELNLALLLVACLDSRGYLSCRLEDLAQEFDLSLPELEQALYVVQMLDPPGVGARSLSECLILQLAQGPHFNGLTVRMARDGLPLLAARNYARLSKLFHVKETEIRQAADVLMALNPIPSQGFGSGAASVYRMPDAIVERENGRLTVSINQRSLPRITIHQEYAALAKTSDDPEVNRYVKEKLSAAQGLISSVQARCSTLQQLIAALVEYQQDFFLRDQDLKPMTLQQLADRLGLNVSTVSRATQEKYLLFNGRTIPLKTFFSVSIPAKGGAAAVSPHAVKQRIARFIQDEDKSSPLSDEALRLALDSSGIVISRRTVAKYRVELGLPSAAARRGPR